MRRDRLTLPLLLLLTLLAGVLRFASLDRPAIWGDEAQTYGRISGTYQQLLDQLTDAAFPPLHYELEWWIGQGMPYWGTFAEPVYPDGPRTFTPTKFIVPGGIRLTPFAFRFIPALAGTLFVPAVYFLAVQWFGRRVALTAACLACFSAYALVFSRDAKMYMHFWLAVTLHVGCCVWWVRTRRLLPWACWVLCGVAMVGLHGTGFYLIAIDALVVFTSPRQHWRHLLTIAAMTVWLILLLPVFAYAKLRRRLRWTERWQFGTFAAWPKRAVATFRWPVVIGFAAGVFVLVMAACGPYGYYSEFSRKMQTVADRPAQTNTGELGIGWVAIYNDGRRLPDYLLYTASAYLTGWEWPRNFDWLPNGDDQARANPTSLRLLKPATVGLLGLLAVGVVPWRRLFAPVRARLDRIKQDGRVWRPFRSRRVWWVGLWLTLIPWATYTQSAPVPANVLDAAAKVFLIEPPIVNWPRLPLPTRSSAGVWDNVEASARAFAQAWPTAWTQYAAAWRPDNTRAAAMVIATLTAIGLLLLVTFGWRAIGRGSVRLLGVIVLLLVLSVLLSVLPRKLNDDVWLPRYLATMLPAFFVFVAVLIDRQPAIVRGLTIGLFVAVNMGQFSARVWGYSDPPTALMAADVVAAQPKAVLATQPDVVTFRAYTAFGGFFSAEPGGGTLMTPAGRYYLRMLTGIPSSPRTVRSSPFFENEYLEMRKFVDPEMIERDLARSPHVQRFVVWSGLDYDADYDPTDPIGDQLKGTFRRVSDEIWPVRDHWRWYERFKVRRQTYERLVPSPGTPGEG